MRLEIESDLSTMSTVEKDIEQNIADAQQDAARLLNEGISAAQSGDRTNARTHLLRVTELDPRNESAWLWLSSISEYPEELLVFLDNVLDINPDNQKALQWRSATKSLLSKTFVQRGIDSYSDGQAASAKQCFEQALIHDESNETAWLWLASLADDNESKIDYLERVLLISPANETAQAAYTKAKGDSVAGMLSDARSAAVSGRRSDAESLLNRIVEAMPESEDAWMLKSHIAESFEDKIAAFKRVLQVNPDNLVAKSSLESLEAILNTASPDFSISQEIKSYQEQETSSENSASQSTYVSSFLLSNPSLTEAAFSEIHDTEDDALDFAEPEQVFVETAEEVSPVFEESQALEEELANVHESVEEESTDNVVQFNPFFDDVTETPDAVFETEEEQSEEVGYSPAVDLHRELETTTNDSTYSLFDAETNEETVVFDQPVEETVAMEVEQGEAFHSEYFEDDKKVELTENSVETKEESVAEAAAHFFDSPETAFGSTFTANEVLNGYSEELTAVDELPEQVIDPVISSEAVSFSEEEFAETIEVQEFDSEEPFHVEIPNDQFTETGNFNSDLKDEYIEEELHLEAADLFDTQGPETDFIPKPFASLEDEVLVEDAHDPYKTVVFENTDPVPFTNPCPFCTSAVSTQSFTCQNCNSVLTLSDIEMLLANQKAEKDLVRVSVEKLEDERRNRSLSNEELINLGIGHLNLRNLHFGFNYLTQAAQADPNNIILKGQVNEIGLRIEEIRQQEVVHESQPKGKTILVVDDSPTVRKLISTKLEKHGHVVVCADDGADALSRLGEVVPDLVLLDITMPNLDGYQVCKQIRTNPLTQDIPVVMISGKDGFFDKVRGRMAGTTGYITKPFGPETLMKTVDLYLNNKEELETVN